eukprot:1143728-Lingulodinium_polyedra.AAC.1
MAAVPTGPRWKAPLPPFVRLLTVLRSGRRAGGRMSKLGTGLPAAATVKARTAATPMAVATRTPPRR